MLSSTFTSVIRILIKAEHPAATPLIGKRGFQGQYCASLPDLDNLHHCQSRIITPRPQAFAAFDVPATEVRSNKCHMNRGRQENNRSKSRFGRLIFEQMGM
jgi:hypothetical protein